ncbi:MAG: helix-turn-helix domain-containing protein [Burkholderiales bacterium]|nr:helix-turn-helix domain-containing protein [Burkholderiales bacterium]
MNRPEISQELRERWGNTAIADGFQPVPHRLLRHQHDLGLSDPQMVVLLNVLDFWWQTERRPFPSAATIGRRIGAAERTVRRHLTALERKGYATKRKSRKGDKTEFDFTGLIHRLSTIVEKAL